MTDNLYDGSVKHWTGKDFPLIGAPEGRRRGLPFHGH